MATNDLTTLANAKDWLGIATGDTSQDARLARLVSAVSTQVQNRIGYLALSQSYTETRNGSGKAVIAFENPHVTAVASVTVDGAAIPARTSVTAAGYTLDPDLLYLVGWCFTKGVQNVVLAYTAGFAAIPLDLEQAVLEVIQVKSDAKKLGNVSSKTLAGEVVSYFRDVAPQTLAAIDNYRRMWVPS